MATLSPYAQWKLEEDERFYATFPQARPHYYHYPQPHVIDYLPSPPLSEPSSSRLYIAPPPDPWQDHQPDFPLHDPPSQHILQPPSPPRGLLPLSPLPAGVKKQVLRKPPLACHFCRGRKIACGAPDPSNPNRTCNQCERRSLKCEYPLESRRGMRKQKSPALPAALSKGKGKLGRRPKACST